jgi:hypothetical protein
MVTTRHMFRTDNASHMLSHFVECVLIVSHSGDFSVIAP